jgi:hypothetical protein
MLRQYAFAHIDIGMKRKKDNLEAEINVFTCFVPANHLPNTDSYAFALLKTCIWVRTKLAPEVSSRFLFSLARALFLKFVGSSMGSVIVVVVVEGVVITAGLLYLDRLEVLRFGGGDGALER